MGRLVTVRQFNDYFLPESQYLVGFQSPPLLAGTITLAQVYLDEASSVGASIGVGGLVTAQTFIVQYPKRSKA